MAYMSQEHKKQIAQLLKERLKAVDCKLKYSLAVDNHSTIVCTIQASDINFIENWNQVGYYQSLVNAEDGYLQVNEYYLEETFTGKALQVLSLIKECLNLNNYVNSDCMSDYVDVGHYVNIQIGKWNKPFNYLIQKNEVSL